MRVDDRVDIFALRAERPLAFLTRRGFRVIFEQRKNRLRLECALKRARKMAESFDDDDDDRRLTSLSFKWPSET